jgi:hypothetical protein
MKCWKRGSAKSANNRRRTASATAAPCTARCPCNHIQGLRHLTFTTTTVTAVNKATRPPLKFTHSVSHAMFDLSSTVNSEFTIVFPVRDSYNIDK